MARLGESWYGIWYVCGVKGFFVHACVVLLLFFRHSCWREGSEGERTLESVRGPRRFFFDLRALATDEAGQLDVLGHDGDAAGVDGAEVGFLKERDDV